jgi:hypothetical protein
MFSIRAARYVELRPPLEEKERESEKRRKIWTKVMGLDVLAPYQGAALK